MAEGIAKATIQLNLPIMHSLVLGEQDNSRIVKHVKT